MKHRRRMAGFSLIEMGIVLGIIAVVVAGGLTIFSNSLQERQLKDTQKKMQVIQDSAQAIGATSNNYFGTEAATPGTCTGGTRSDLRSPLE